MNESVSKEKKVVLIDLLDRILFKGVIILGDVTISVANVDLVYLGVKVLLTSVDKVAEFRKRAAEGIIGHIAPDSTGDAVIK
ncbi:MAG: gas vesicle protein [Chloroflexi bacterium]|nr:gas vesicle protein [Chloroflexota bacterium]